MSFLGVRLSLVPCPFCAVRYLWSQVLWGWDMVVGYLGGWAWGTVSWGYVSEEVGYYGGGYKPISPEPQKRAVHIILECFLVIHWSSFSQDHLHSGHRGGTLHRKRSEGFCLWTCISEHRQPTLTAVSFWADTIWMSQRLDRSTAWRRRTTWRSGTNRYHSKNEICFIRTETTDWCDEGSPVADQEHYAGRARSSDCQ